ETERTRHDLGVQGRQGEVRAWIELVRWVVGTLPAPRPNSTPKTRRQALASRLKLDVPSIIIPVLRKRRSPSGLGDARSPIGQSRQGGQGVLSSLWDSNPGGAESPSAEGLGYYPPHAVDPHPAP